MPPFYDNRHLNVFVRPFPGWIFSFCASVPLCCRCRLSCKTRSLAKGRDRDIDLLDAIFLVNAVASYGRPQGGGTRGGREGGREGARTEAHTYRSFDGLKGSVGQPCVGQG